MAEVTINVVKKLIHESNYLVVVSGSGMQRECGHQSLRDQERAYDIEARYKYSPEEMFSSAFYSTRTEPFFQFYKREVLLQDMQPGSAYKTLAKLEHAGIVKVIISAEIYGMSKKAGCTNVLELHGNIENNFCPRCGRHYSKEYLLEAKKVPLCEDCLIPIRPGIRFYGEMVDNANMTRVSNEIAKADVMLVLGTRLSPEFCENYLSYYTGRRLILINNENHFEDSKADYMIHGSFNEILPELL